MTFCIYCGQELVEGARFCASCGKVVGDECFASKRKFVYEGKIHKCPNCGEIINSFVSNCPSCGYEIRDIQGASSVEKLVVKLENLESNRKENKNMNIFKQALGTGMKLQSVDEQKINIIRNFNIPNAKEDILEFIVLAASNIDLKVYGLDSNRYQTFEPARRELSDAWLAKFEQAFQKAEIMFGNTQDFLYMKTFYENKMKAIKKQKRQIIWLIVVVFGSLLLVLGIPLTILALTGRL